VREADAKSRTEKCSTQCEANAESNKCTKLTPRQGSAEEDIETKAGRAVATIAGLPPGAGKCKRLMPRSGEVQEADAEERGSAGS
jgi:hypothetical protein